MRLQHRLHCNPRAALLALSTSHFHEKSFLRSCLRCGCRDDLAESPLQQIASAVCNVAAPLIATALNQPWPRNDLPCADQSACQSCFSRLQQACHICICTMHMTYFSEDASIWRLIPSADHLDCIDLSSLSASWSATSGAPGAVLDPRCISMSCKAHDAVQFALLACKLYKLVDLYNGGLSLAGNGS